MSKRAADPPSPASDSMPRTAGDKKTARPCVFEASFEEGAAAVFRLAGRLDTLTAGEVWRKADRILEARAPRALILQIGEVDYCDGAGIAFVLYLRERFSGAGREFEIRGLAPGFKKMIAQYEGETFADPTPARPLPNRLPEDVGRATVALWKDFHNLISYVGECAAALAFAARYPGRVRWKDALMVAERSGVNALPIVALIGFLVGLIMAFQSAIPMKQFGAEIFVANLVAISMIRELGPLMTAILLAGRSGSAFAAEIGAMKVNEEVNALMTMGIDPVRFLVVTRVLAATLMIPVLTVFAELAGLVGGAIVVLSFGYPLVTYVNQAFSFVSVTDLLGGLLKAGVFGILVAGVGCLRGLQTRTGASAVGDSTTSAVVSGIVLIAVTDGVFSVAYYYLGI